MQPIPYSSSAGSWVRFALALGCALLPLRALALTRGLEISSTPSGAQITINGVNQGPTPLTIKRFDFQGSVQYKIEATKEGYAPKSVTVDYAQARQQKMNQPWRIHVGPLDEIVRKAKAAVVALSPQGQPIADPIVTIQGNPVADPLDVPLVFQRKNASEPWPTLEIRVDKPPRYAPAVHQVRLEEASASADPLRLRIALGEIRREIAVEIKANIDAAEVSTNGTRLTVLPTEGLRQVFVFSRPTPDAEWPVYELTIAKEGFEYDPPGGTLPEPAFARRITADSGAALINAEHFKPVRFVLSPVRLFDVRSDGVQVTETNLLSQVNAGGQEKPSAPMTAIDPERPLVLSRVSVVPDSPDRFVYSIPIRERRAPNSSTPASAEAIVGANIVLRQQSGLTPMTEGRYFDIDPFVTKDWIYFSSDRSRIRIIWRIPLSGKGGYTPITGSHTKFDTEPAVSPDETKLAFVSRDPDAPPSSTPWIWISDAEGKLPTQHWAGRSPAWSPDGKKIAFVSPDNGLWVVDVETGSQKQFPIRDSIVASPVWKPNGKEIVFVSNRGINDRKERNFDLWLISVEDSKELQLTSDGSFDASPAISHDGQFAYFFSNRGATRHGQDRFQIYRLALE